jgi:hypothetical protein
LNNMILPNIAVQNSKSTARAGSYLQNWSPMKIYDRYLVSANTGIHLVDYANSIFQFGITPGTLFETFVSAFENSGSAYQDANSVYQFATTSRSISLRSTSNTDDDLTIYTTNTFNQGQSISHVDGTIYSSTPDFLMSHNDDGVCILTKLIIHS